MDTNTLRRSVVSALIETQETGKDLYPAVLAILDEQCPNTATAITIAQWLIDAGMANGNFSGVTLAGNPNVFVNSLTPRAWDYVNGDLGSRPMVQVDVTGDNNQLALDSTVVNSFNQLTDPGVADRLHDLQQAFDCYRDQLDPQTALEVEQDIQTLANELKRPKEKWRPAVLEALTEGIKSAPHLIELVEQLVASLL